MNIDVFNDRSDLFNKSNLFSIKRFYTTHIYTPRCDCEYTFVVYRDGEIIIRSYNFDRISANTVLNDLSVINEIKEFIVFNLDIFLRR